MKRERDSKAPSTIDLMKKRLAENARAAGASQGVVTTKERADFEKRTPTKILQFASDATDEPRTARTRNTS